MLPSTVEECYSSLPPCMHHLDVILIEPGRFMIDNRAFDANPALPFMVALRMVETGHIAPGTELRVLQVLILAPRGTGWTHTALTLHQSARLLSLARRLYIRWWKTLELYDRTDVKPEPSMGPGRVAMDLYEMLKPRYDTMVVEGMKLCLGVQEVTAGVALLAINDAGYTGDHKSVLWRYLDGALTDEQFDAYLERAEARIASEAASRV